MECVLVFYLSVIKYSVVWMKYEYLSLAEWYWKEETEVLGDKS
jgi:hypothetical protein